MKIRSRWLLSLLPLSFFVLTIFSVLKQDQRLSAVGPYNKNRKFDHLVLGPAAGRGLPNRLQCQGTKALNQTHSSKLSRDPTFMDTVVFVTVFAVYNWNGRPETHKFVNTSRVKADRSIAVLNVFINFIQVTMPQSTVVILTSPEVEPPVFRKGVIIHHIHGDYSRNKLMLQRIRSYIAFLETKVAEVPDAKKGGVDHFVFVDSDIVVVDDLGHIFQQNPHFHVALTFRNNKHQPINSGFIAVNGSPIGLIRAKAFLEKVGEIYEGRFANASRMLGDQLALAYLISSHHSRFVGQNPFIEDVAGTSVLFLPCSLYNWTPPEGAGQFHGVPLPIKIVHFKGSRKRLMLQSWDFFTSGHGISDVLCLILSSGRTKYDF